MKSFLNSEQRDFVYGTLKYRYDLIVQDRKTINLTVRPDLSITLKSPSDLSSDRIDAFLKRKWFWLEKQLRFFKKYQRTRYKKEYLSGESFLYLGRQYKLVVRESQEDRVILGRGQIVVHTKRKTSDGRYTQKLLYGWFDRRAVQVFNKRYEEVQDKFDEKVMPKLILRDMPKRWGSFLGKEKIILNPKLIHASKECIDYVITHELCHLKYKKHDKNFFKLLEKKYPKWEKVKDKLEEFGARVVD